MNGNNPNEEVADATIPKEELPQGVTYEGKVYTPKDIENLLNTKANLEAGFTPKLQKLAEERKALEAERSAAAQREEDMAALVEAMNEDREAFGKMESAEEVARYEPRANVVAKKIGIFDNDGRKRRAAPEVIEAISEVKNVVEELRKDRALEAATRGVDTVLGAVNAATVSYPCASKSDLHDKVKMFQLENGGKLPSVDWVASEARALHDRDYARGVRPASKTPKEEGKMKDRPGPSGNPPPVLEEQDVPDLNNPGSMRKGFKAYLDKKASQAGG